MNALKDRHLDDDQSVFIFYYSGATFNEAFRELILFGHMHNIRIGCE